MPLLSPEHWGRLLDGALVTVKVTAFAVVLGSVLGLAGGVAVTSGGRIVRGVVRVYVEVFRGVSALILLFWATFSVPQLLGVRLSVLVAAVLALGTNMGAYCTELVRGAIGAVPAGQSEAAVACHLTPYRRLRHVVLPQALVALLPPYGNLIVEVLKASALVSLLPGLEDLMRSAQILRNNRTQIGESTTEIYLATLVLYFLMARVITGGLGLAERRLSRGLDVGRAGNRVNAP